MTLQKISVGGPSHREIVELAINNALPHIDDLPNRGEYDITQSQLEAELSDIATTGSDIRPVVRGQPSAVSVSESESAMNAVAASGTAMDAVAESDTAMEAVAGARTAMDAVSASQTARDAINTRQAAFDAVAAENMAIGKFVAGEAGLTPSNFAGIDEVGASQTARDAINASQAALDAVAAVGAAVTKFTAGEAGLTPSDFANLDRLASSRTARDAITGNQRALDAVALSNASVGKFVTGLVGLNPLEFADMGAVADSQTAMDAVGGSGTATDIIARSAVGLSELHLSDFVEGSYWSVSNSLDTWNSGTITTNSDMSVFTGQSGDDLGNGTFSTPIDQGYSIGAVLKNGNGTGEGKWEGEFDFDKIDEVVLTTRIDNSSAFDISVLVGGTEVIDANSGTTTHTVPVNKRGIQTLTIDFVDTNFSVGEFCEVGVLKFNSQLE